MFVTGLGCLRVRGWEGKGWEGKGGFKDAIGSTFVEGDHILPLTCNV